MAPRSVSPTPRLHSLWAWRPSPYLGCSKHFFRHGGPRGILSVTKIVLAPSQEEDASSRHSSRHGGRVLSHPQIYPPPSSCRYNVPEALHNPKEFHVLRARPGRIRRPALTAAAAAHGRSSNGRKRASKKSPIIPSVVSVWPATVVSVWPATAHGISFRKLTLSGLAWTTPSYERWRTTYRHSVPSLSRCWNKYSCTRLSFSRDSMSADAQAPSSPRALLQRLRATVGRPTGIPPTASRYWLLCTPVHSTRCSPIQTTLRAQIISASRAAVLRVASGSRWDLPSPLHPLSPWRT